MPSTLTMLPLLGRQLAGTSLVEMKYFGWLELMNGTKSPDMRGSRGKLVRSPPPTPMYSNTVILASVSYKEMYQINHFCCRLDNTEEKLCLIFSVTFILKYLTI